MRQTFFFFFFFFFFLSLCFSVLLAFVITSFGEERVSLSAFRVFVCFARVGLCLFPLPLGVRIGFYLCLWHFNDFSGYLFHILPKCTGVGGTLCPHLILYHFFFFFN